MTTWLDDFVTVMRHEMIIHRTRAFIANQDWRAIENGTPENAPDYALKGSLSRSTPETLKTQETASICESGAIYMPGCLSDTQAAAMRTANPIAAKFAYCDAFAAMIAHATPVEPIEDTIKRATGHSVVSISIDDPNLDAKLRAAWGSWGGR